MTQIPGRNLVRTFSEKERACEARIAALDADIRAREGRLAQANAQREAAYARLAALYLDHSGEAFGPVSDVTRELQAIFDHRIARRAEIDDALARARAQREAARSELEAARGRAASAAVARDAVRQRVIQAIEADPDCSRHLEEAKAARQTADEAERDLGELRKECAAKLSAYESDALFRYLVRRGYGEDSYPGSGIVARLDGWVATAVNWTENGRSHAVLTKLPAFAEKRLEDLRAKVLCAQARVDTDRRDLEAREGLPALESSVAQTAAEAARLSDLAARIEADMGALETERQAIDKGGDPYLAKAKARIREALESDTLEGLKARARSTPSPDDDQAVDWIEQAEAVIQSERKAIREAKGERDAQLAQIGKIREAHREFERRYTGPYDYFRPTVDMDSVLAGYVAGTLAESVLWSTMRSSHVDLTPAATSASWGSASSDPGSSGVSFGGGDSGGATFGGADSSGGSSFGGGS